jgi:hypothetical protein
MGAFGALERFSAKPGAVHEPGPAVAFLAAYRKSDRPLLVMAMHPRCPCTEASLGELSDLLARTQGACDALILRYQAPGWPRGQAVENLGEARVPVIPDPEGKLAAGLGMETSGQCIFWDARGALRYYGGLTLSRGHRGRSPAQDAILVIVAGGNSTLKFAPVYGCSLLSDCSPASPDEHRRSL